VQGEASRARHPAARRVPGRRERTRLLDLTHRVLGAALQDWPSFATIGVPIELSINVPLVALTKLSIFGIMWEKKPDNLAVAGTRAGDLEDEAAGNVTLLRKATDGAEILWNRNRDRQFRPALLGIPAPVRRAVHGDEDRPQLHSASCDSDPVNRGLERNDQSNLPTIPADRRRRKESRRAAELNTLRQIGCEIGQGYLFARPQPKNELIQLLRQRSKARTAPDTRPIRDADILHCSTIGPACGKGHRVNTRDRRRGDDVRRVTGAAA
jgi:hypothetical protein